MLLVSHPQLLPWENMHINDTAMFTLSDKEKWQYYAQQVQMDTES